MGQKTEGIIARLNKGFGFIEIPNHDDVFFFHAQDLQNNQAFDELRPKMVVSFVPIDDDRKPGKTRGSEVTVLHDKGPKFGFIKSLNNGFGFLGAQGDDVDYFFHRRDMITRIPFDELVVGMEMTFVPISGKNGKPAASKCELSMPGGPPKHGGNRGGGQGMYHGKPQGFSYGQVGHPPHGGPGPYGRAPPSYGHAQRYNPYGAPPSQAYGHAAPQPGKTWGHPAAPHAPSGKTWGHPAAPEAPGKTWGHPSAPQAPAPWSHSAPPAHAPAHAPPAAYGAPHAYAPAQAGYAAPPAQPPASQAYTPAQAGYGRQY